MVAQNFKIIFIATIFRIFPLATKKVAKKYIVYMKNNKKYIDTYNTVYGVEIVVANKAVTLKDLQKLYIYTDGNDLDGRIIDSQCTTARCLNKKTNRHCILVKYNEDSSYKDVDKKLDLIDSAAHEAGHVVLDLYDFAGETEIIASQEPFCYTLGWITANIYKTWTKK